MDRLDRYEIFEQCLRQLQMGRSLDEVLAPYGEQAAELRPLLETAVIAGSLRPDRQVPASAENRSRALFLTRAGQNRGRQTRPWAGWFPRLSPAILTRVVMIALVLSGIVGTGFTSAKSIPGDTLYPVKIAVEKARLSFAGSPESRLELEQSFDQERVDESHQVLQLGRSQMLSFAGYLEREDGSRWEVGKIHLILTPEQAALAAGLDNLYVDVAGQADGEQMTVKDLRVRLFEFTGVIERAESNWLTVSGVRVRLDQRSQLQLQPATARTVRISAVRHHNGDLIALLVAPSEAPGVTVTYQPGLFLPLNTTTPQPFENQLEDQNDDHSEKSAPDIQITPKPEDHTDHSEIEPQPSPKPGDHEDGEEDRSGDHENSPDHPSGD